MNLIPKYQNGADINTLADQIRANPFGSRDAFAESVNNSLQNSLQRVKVKRYTDTITSNRNSEIIDKDNLNRAIEQGAELGLSPDQAMADYQTQSPAIESVHPEMLFTGAGLKAAGAAGKGVMNGAKAIGNWFESKLPGIGKAVTAATGVEGARHFLSPEGGAKTFNKMYQGDWGGAGLSAVGDLLDLTGMKQASTMYNLAKNSGLPFSKALELQGMGTGKMVQNMRDQAEPTIQSLSSDLQQAKAEQEKASSILQSFDGAELGRVRTAKQIADQLKGRTWLDPYDPFQGPQEFKVNSFLKQGSQELEKELKFQDVLKALREPDRELPRSLRVSTRIGSNHTYTPEQLQVFYSRHPELSASQEISPTSTSLTHYRTGDVHQVPTVTSDLIARREHLKDGLIEGAAVRIFPGVPEDKLTPGDLAVIDDNIKYIQEQIPGFQPIGSSQLARAGALPKNPHDIDGEISVRDFNSLLNHYGSSPRLTPRNPEKGMWSFTPVDKTGTPRPEWNVDVNVVDPREHNKDLATEIYKQFYPEAYAAQHDFRIGTGQDFKFQDINGTPVTSEQLIQKVRENPTVKSIMDAFEIVPEGVKTKHALKPLQILASPATEDTARALENLSLRYYGTPRVLPKLTQQLPPEEVSKMLQELQVPRNIANSIASDPKKVQNFMDWYALSEASLMRGITPPEAPVTNLQAMTEWKPGIGGSLAGAGLNMTHGGSSNFGRIPGNVTGHVFLDPKAWDTTNIKTALDSFRKLLPKGHIQADKDLSMAKAKFYSEMANKFPGARGFSGDAYGSGVYAGMLDLKPGTDIIRMSPDDEALVGLTRRMDSSMGSVSHFVRAEHPWQRLQTKRILQQYADKYPYLGDSPISQLPKEVIYGTSQNPGIIPLLKKYESYTKQIEDRPLVLEYRDQKAFAADQLREALSKYKQNLNENIGRVLSNKDLRKFLDYKPNPYYQPAFWATRQSQKEK